MAASANDGAKGEYRLVVLDEVSVAIQLGVLSEAEVLNFLENRPRTLDVILTGPEMPGIAAGDR